MGADIHVKIVKKNYNTEKWEEIKLYKKDKENNDDFIDIDFFPFRNYELFDILSGRYESSFPFDVPIYTFDLPNNLKKEIETNQQTFGYYNFKEINLADLKLYLHDHPTILDEDNYIEEENKYGLKDNPLKSFVNRIENIIDIANESLDDCPPSHIRIIYWFDR